MAFENTLRGPWKNGAKNWITNGGKAGLFMILAKIDGEKFTAFLAEQPDLGPKQWPSFVRVGAQLPRTETFKVIKRQLSAEGTECADPVWPIARQRPVTGQR